MQLQFLKTRQNAQLFFLHYCLHLKQRWRYVSFSLALVVFAFGDSQSLSKLANVVFEKLKLPKRKADKEHHNGPQYRNQ
jgi:hypothetical protein